MLSSTSREGLTRPEVEKPQAKKEDLTLTLTLTLAIADPALYREEGDSAKLAALQKELG